jgi:hypothetical protein
MDNNIVTCDPHKAQYGDGVFIRLTGGKVHEFQPRPKVDGYLDAATMTAKEAAGWLAYCVNVLGYVYNGKGAGHAC